MNTKPHAVAALSDGTSFTYNANGNMTSRAKAGTSTIYYTYDVENRLTQVASGAWTQAQFNYDGDGGRTKKISYTNGIPSATTMFIGNLYELSGSRTTRHIYFGSQVVADVTNGQVLYNHTDHLGVKR